MPPLKIKRETHPIQPRRTRGWWETGELVWMHFWVELDVGQLRSRRTSPTFLALVRRYLDQVHHTQKTNDCHEGYLLHNADTVVRVNVRSNKCLRPDVTADGTAWLLFKRYPPDLHSTMTQA